MKNDLVSIRLAVTSIGALIFALLLMAGCDDSSFRYQARVMAKATGNYLQNATVTIEVSGKAPLDSVTDANGLAVIDISSEYVGQPARVIVDANGYERFVQNIDLNKNALPKVIQLSALALATPNSIPNSTPRSEPTSIPTATPDPCVCRRETDEESLRCLILAESQAANEGSMETIRKIFAPDAIVARRDITVSNVWPARSYYSDTFATTVFSSATHFSPTLYISNQMTFAASGSRGYYTPRGGGETRHYDNQPPSDHWTFGINDQGCWVITQLEFNAAHIPFPPTPQAQEAVPTKKP